jgi:alcohol dehydrogenase (cytochrome c)
LETTIKRKLALIVGALVVAVATYGGAARNYLLTLSTPAGAVSTETNPAYEGDTAYARTPAHSDAAWPSAAVADWPSYNRTLSSQRYSPLDQINTKNVGQLKVLCTYDLHEFTSFESSLIMVDGALIGTSEFDIFSLNPATCAENWRKHLDYPGALLPSNRGAAYMDGALFRGTQDGRVLAFDFKTGKQLLETRIADPKRGESVPAAPTAWDGLIYISNSGGDYKSGKGHMYALEAKSGKIVWELFVPPRVPGDPAPDFASGVPEGINLHNDSAAVLDARTGDFGNNIKVVPVDWHDYDLADNDKLLYRLPITTIESDAQIFTIGKAAHFCPGVVGGDEWNTPGYDPTTNLIISGTVDWCDTGQPWAGMAALNPLNMFGKEDKTDGHRAGWVYATDADTGVWKWRVMSNFPIVGAITPTAGGVVFFGDVGGNFYALNSSNGQKLWGQSLDGGGGIGGGIITYTVDGAQKIAVADGFTMVTWPTKPVTAKVIILGLDNVSSRP